MLSFSPPPVLISRYANKPRCRQYTEERCQNHPIKSCRTVTETKTIVGVAC